MDSSCRKWSSDGFVEVYRSGRRLAVHDFLTLSIPIHLSALAIAARGHDHRHGMRESAFDTAVRRLPIPHACQPVIGMSLQVVVLTDRRRFPGARRQHRFRLGFPGTVVEHDIRAPDAPRFGDEPPLRAALAAR